MTYTMTFARWLLVILLATSVSPDLGQAAPAAADSAKKERVAVLDITLEGGSAGEKAALTDKFRESLLKTKKYTLVDRSQMNRILQEQAFQKTACTTADCAVAAGKLLGVRYIITTSVTRITLETWKADPETWKLNADVWQASSIMVNVETAETDRAESVQVRGNVLKLLNEGIPELATKLSSEETPSAPAAAVAPPPPPPPEPPVAAQPAPEVPAAAPEAEALPDERRKGSTVLSVGVEENRIDYSYKVKDTESNGRESVYGRGMSFVWSEFINGQGMLLMGVNVGNVTKVKTCPEGCATTGYDMRPKPATGTYMGFSILGLAKVRDEPGLNVGIGAGASVNTQKYSVIENGKSTNFTATQMGEQIHLDAEWRYQNGWVIGAKLEALLGLIIVGTQQDRIKSGGHQKIGAITYNYGVYTGWAF